MASKSMFSIIVAMYNVETYVDAFLDSLLAQTTPIESLDIIIVDDGSSDSSVHKVEQWNNRHGRLIRLISKMNGGPGSARNVGLEHAIGEWVTFCDPDDVLHCDYFSEVEQFLDRDQKNRAQLLTTRLVQHEDGTIRVNHKHPLDWKFRHGSRLVDLNELPNHVQLSGGTTFLKRSIIETESLRFDERIRPKFEDANFIGRYIAVASEPIVGIVSKARYFYRKRADGSSLVQGAWSDPRAYDEVPNFGYLGMLEFIQKRLGHTPAWAQYMVLYDLVWMHIADKSMHSHIGSITSEQQETMLTALDQIMVRMDRNAITEFSAVGMGWTFYNMLLHHYKTPLEPIPVVIDWGTDSDRNLRKMSYMFVGCEPEEQIFLGSAPQMPFTEKVIDHSLFGRVLVRERSFTMPEGAVQVFLNGQRARITQRTDLPNRRDAVLSDNPSLKLHSPRPAISGPTNGQGQIRGLGGTRVIDANRDLSVLTRGLKKVRLQAQLTGKSNGTAAAAASLRVLARKFELGEIGRESRRQKADQALVLTASEAAVQRKYRNAWVLIDRKDRADDNAEHLYRHLSKETSENIWFLLERTSPDWDRLSNDGFKLVGYGSDESVRLVLNANYVISSHADREIQYPIDMSRFGKSKAKIIFLQHGVTKDDLSRWINGKNLSLMITASINEHHSIVGHNNPYKWGESTVKLTGFPRHDNLVKLTRSTQPEQRNTILIAPTWRQYVTDVLKSYSTIQEKIEHFRATDFGKSWLRVLEDDRLRVLCQELDVRVAFLGHPNLGEIVEHLELPGHIAVLSYDGLSVQETLVESSIVVSDYSSLAFDGAIAGASIVHFQFDGNEIYKGGHVYRKGYFDYDLQGFGNVCKESSEVVGEILRISQNNFKRDEHFDVRVKETFPLQDGNASARVTRAIKNLERSWDSQLPLEEI